MYYAYFTNVSWDQSQTYFVTTQTQLVSELQYISNWFGYHCCCHSHGSRWCISVTSNGRLEKQRHSRLFSFGHFSWQYFVGSDCMFVFWASFTIRDIVNNFLNTIFKVTESINHGWSTTVLCCIVLCSLTPLLLLIVGLFPIQQALSLKAIAFLAFLELVRTLNWTCTMLA